jgi:tripartite-type tricarboxylate transporter receptor subunit TctC
MQELVEYAKANPGKLTYGSSGTFGSSHFPIEMLIDMENLDMVHVPFDGGGPCLMALLGKQVDFIGGMPSTVKSQYDAGEVRILAQMSSERIATLPDVPTLKELGYDIVYGNWRTVFAPAGTPEARVQELRTAFKELMEDKSFQLLIKQLGEEVLYLDGPDFQVEWDKEFAAQEKTAKRIADQFVD